ncbi:MAG: class I SAM-dependent methyltransferase [Candidatus Sungiibacteriota bacterium]
MQLPTLLNKFQRFFTKDGEKPKKATPVSSAHSAVHIWGRNYEERYKSWDKEGRLTRPSSQEIEIYRRFMGPLSGRENILVLGPTPELRDLASGCRVVVADLSFTNIITAAKYLKRARPEAESHIESDWLSLSYPPGYFNIILGDLVLNQFPPGKKEKKFFETMRRLCAPSGCFISRFIFLNSTFQPENLRYKVGRILERKWLSHREKVFATATAAVCCAADHSIRMNNLYMAWVLLEDLLKSGGFNWYERKAIKRAVSYLKENGLPGGRWWSYSTEEYLLDLVTKHFIIADRRHATDHPAESLLPLFRCIPKTVK